MWPVQLAGAEPPVRSGTLGSPPRAASQEQAHGRATPALKWQARPTFQLAQNSWALFRPAWAPTGCQTQLTVLRRRLLASPKADRDLRVQWPLPKPPPLSCFLAAPVFLHGTGALPGLPEQTQPSPARHPSCNLPHKEGLRRH